MRYLIVDDHRDIREALCELVVESGHEAHAVSDVRAAMCALRLAEFDIVVVDWKIGVDTGDVLLLAITALRSPAAVVVCSAFDGARRVADAWSVPFVKKPFGIEEWMTTTLRAALDQRVPRAPDASHP